MVRRLFRHLLGLLIVFCQAQLTIVYRFARHCGCGKFGRMFSIRVVLCALLWPLCAVHGQETLYLTFGQGQNGATKTYGTATISYPPVLSVQEGQRVILQKSHGTDYRVEASSQGWSWAQVQQIAVAETSISVIPKRQGDSVSVEVNYYLREGDQSVSYSSTVQGRLGQWIPLLQPSTGNSVPGTKVYSAWDSNNMLALKVEHRIGSGDEAGSDLTVPRVLMRKSP